MTSAVIRFSDVEGLAGEEPVLVLEPLAGLTRLTIEQDGKRCVLVFAPNDAKDFGCAFVVAAHASELEFARRAAPPVAIGGFAAEEPTKRVTREWEKIGERARAEQNKTPIPEVSFDELIGVLTKEDEDGEP